jgi:hypothetical protein
MNINHSAHKSLLVDFIFIHCTLLIMINWAMQYNKFVCEWSSLGYLSKFKSAVDSHRVQLHTINSILNTVW